MGRKKPKQAPSKAIAKPTPAVAEDTSPEIAAPTTEAAAATVGTDESAQLELLRSALQEKAWDRGLEQAAVALAAFPASRQLALLQGQLLLESGRIDEAEAAFAALSKQHPRLMGAAIGLARVASAKRDWPLAVLRWSRCREKFADKPAEMQARWKAAEARARLALDQPDQAAKLFQAVVADLPSRPLGYIGLAQVAARRGDSDLALKCWEDCLQRFPDHPGREDWRGAVTRLQSKADKASPLRKNMP